jgi:rare lipoprotein A
MSKWRGVEHTASQRIVKVEAPAWYAVGCPSIRLGPDAMIHGFVILLSVLITTAANAGESGMASHYSSRDKDQNRNRTACGPPLRDHELTAAHKSLPCGTRIRVTNKGNGRSTIVTITDRGPFVRGRVIDLSIGAAQALGFHGLARVSLGRI